MVEIKSMTGEVLMTVDGDSLKGAYLKGADLSGADLSGADLSGANMDAADLSGANMDAADLSGAYLQGANLTGAILPSGHQWEVYLAEIVPALLTAGGRSLAEVATPEHWSCKTWSNCPMAAAFGITSAYDLPPLLQSRIFEFVQFFDAGLIPMPAVD